MNQQFEQLLNGKFVEKLGVGIAHLDFTEDDLRSFIQNLDTYKRNLRKYNPGNQQKTLQIIEQEILAVIATYKHR